MLDLGGLGDGLAGRTLAQSPLVQSATFGWLRESPCVQTPVAGATFLMGIDLRPSQPLLGILLGLDGLGRRELASLRLEHEDLPLELLLGCSQLFDLLA